MPDSLHPVSQLSIAARQRGTSLSVGRWRRRACAAVLFSLACGLWANVSQADAGDCGRQTDDQLRLACYDRAFAAGQPVAATGAPHPPLPLASSSAEKVDSVMNKAWELTPENKRGAFVLRTYQPNFLLPVHYSSNINRSPHSPTQAAGASHSEYSSVEAKLQISLRAKVVENLLLPGADLWFAYTQRSLWQIWDQQDSSPFRSTDYQPEAIYIIPVPADIGDLPLDWKLRLVQFGFAHQSNGQSDPLSRSWNRLYAGVGLEHGDFGLMLRLNRRLSGPGADDNPDLTDYICRGEIAMNWFPGASTLSLSWRTNLQDFNRGSLQFDWTHPVFSSQPSGLRWYAQLFTGYGETLLDYNHRQTRLGLGLSLFQF